MDKIILTWAKAEGYETWLTDHSAVMRNLSRYIARIRAEAKAEALREAAERAIDWVKSLGGVQRWRETVIELDPNDYESDLRAAILADQASEAEKVEGPEAVDLWQERNLPADIEAIFDNNEGSDGAYDIGRIKVQIADFIKQCPNGYLYKSGEQGGMHKAAQIIQAILPVIARGGGLAEIERRIREGE